MADQHLISRLTVVNGPAAGQVVDLGPGGLVIGRMEPSGLIINNPEISRQHARISHQLGVYFIEDLGSKNGTKINGHPILGSQALANGDLIQLGAEISILFSQQEFGAQPGEQPTFSPHAQPKSQPRYTDKTMFEAGTGPAAAKVQAPASSPQLEITIAGNPPEVHTLTKDRINLGRADDNDLVIPSLIVSRHHATSSAPLRATRCTSHLVPPTC